MAIAYFDSSALVKLVVDEADSDLAADLWDGADAVVTAAIAFAEVRAALAAAHRDRRLSAAQHRRAIRGWAGYWGEVRTITITPALAEPAGELAEQHAMRGYDAVHLSCALALDDPDVIVVGWDHRLQTAAAAVGLRTAPLTSTSQL